jgi:hypothetical protein
MAKLSMSQGGGFRGRERGGTGFIEPKAWQASRNAPAALTRSCMGGDVRPKLHTDRR